MIGLDPRLPSRLDLSLRPPIPPHAAHSTGLLGVQLLREHHVSHGTIILLRHHISGVQWYVFSRPEKKAQLPLPARINVSTSTTIPEPNRDPPRAYTSVDGIVVYQFVHL